MRYILVSLFLVWAAQTTAANNPPLTCRYRLECADTGNIPGGHFVFDQLNTSVINLYLEGIHGFERDIAGKPFSISIEGVCNIGPEWDYHLYQVSENVRLSASSSVQDTRRSQITVEQAAILQGARFLHLDITLMNWTPGQSTFDTVTLLKTQTRDKVHLIEGSEKVLQDTKIHLFGETPQEYHGLFSEEEPRVGSAFKFPLQHDCIFRSNVEGIDYSVQSSGQSWLVQSELSWEAWQTVGLAQNGGSCSYPAEQDEVVNERRVYVFNNEQTVTSVKWLQNNLKLWLTVVSKPLKPGPNVDLSLYKIVDAPVPIHRPIQDGKLKGKSVKAREL